MVSGAQSKDQLRLFEQPTASLTEQPRRNHGADVSYLQVLILILCEIFVCVCFFIVKSSYSTVLFIKNLIMRFDKKLDLPNHSNTLWLHLLQFHFVPGVKDGSQPQSAASKNTMYFNNTSQSLSDDFIYLID